MSGILLIDHAASRQGKSHSALRSRSRSIDPRTLYIFKLLSFLTVYIVFQTVLYVIFIFPMLGFEWKIVKFFYFYYFILMCFIYYNLYGMMAVALTPVHLIATIVMSFFLCLWNLFGGFPVPKRASAYMECTELILPVIVKRLNFEV
ncbi:hypothetical protein Drorol1_Dr00024972 [Drosera rotundifolia]